jgi:hypothetical protein
MTTRMGTQNPEGEISPLESQYDAPHIPEKCKAGLMVANAGKSLAEFDGDTSQVLDRLRTGERAVDIAKDLGVSHVALYAWLLRHSPEEWKAISAGKALARVEQAECDMDAAEDQVAVSKARESHRMGAWALERVARNLYGDNKAGDSGVVVQVIVDRGLDNTVTVEAAR